MKWKTYPMGGAAAEKMALRGLTAHLDLPVVPQPLLVRRRKTRKRLQIAKNQCRQLWNQLTKADHDHRRGESCTNVNFRRRRASL